MLSLHRQARASIGAKRIWMKGRARVMSKDLVRLALVGLIVALIPLIFLVQFRMGEIARLTWFLSGITALLILGVQRIYRSDWLSPQIAYAVVFWMFHFGLVFPASITPSLLERFDPWNIEWVYNPETGKAVLLSLLFLAAFTLGWTWLYRGADTSQPAAEVDGEKAQELILAGWLVIACGLGYFGLALARFGITILLQSYTSFFAVHNDFSWSIVVVAYGLVLQLAGRRPTTDVIKTMLWAYLPLTGLVFWAGARTAPMFSMIVLGIVLAKRGLRISRLGLWVAAIVTLLVIAFVQQTRQYGLLELLESSEATATVESPLAGMTELGGSLRPVSATVHYVDVAGNGPFWGQTYIYPIVRQGELLLGLPRGNPETERRFIATHISLLYSAAMGYSVVAEAYVNAGVVGVIVFALLWGFLLSVLDRRSRSPYGLGLLGAILFPMMINIRNSFIFVPIWIFLAGMVLLFSRFLLRGLVPRLIKVSLFRRRPVGRTWRT